MIGSNYFSHFNLHADGGCFESWTLIRILLLLLEEFIIIIIDRSSSEFTTSSAGSHSSVKVTLSGEPASARLPLSFSQGRYLAVQAPSSTSSTNLFLTRTSGKSLTFLHKYSKILVFPVFFLSPTPYHVVVSMLSWLKSATTFLLFSRFPTLFPHFTQLNYDTFSDG